MEIIEVDVITNEESRLLVGGDFVTIDTLRFKNRKEVFCRSIVLSRSHIKCDNEVVIQVFNRR